MAAPRQTYPSFTPTYHTEPYPAIDPSQPALSCANKTVLITGAGAGIGKAIALGFARAQAAGIAVVGRTQSTLESTAAEIRAISPATQTVVIPLDITRSAEVAAAIQTAVAAWGRAPDVLVNNAGGNPDGSTAAVADLDLDALRRTFELNVMGPLAVAQAFARAHQSTTPAEHGRPRVVLINVASGAAHLPYAPNAAAYSTSKLAGAKLTEYLHYELPAWNVFNLHPGVVQTELARRAGRLAPDSDALPAAWAVWLAAAEQARELNGRFVWSNWDVDELLQRKDEIHRRDLLTLALKGWADDTNADDLMRRARDVHRNADSK